MENITIKLWVSNQPGDSDQTAAYVAAADWLPQEGVAWDADACTLSGPAEKTWRQFRQLNGAVEAAGHGDDDADRELGPPVLTACPVEVIEPGYTSAAESVARLASVEALTWAEFCERR